MKKLTFEKYKAIIDRRHPLRLVESDYKELLPYLQDEDETSAVQVARVEVAEQVLYRLLESPNVAAGNPEGMVAFAYQCADELIKQAKQ